MTTQNLKRFALASFFFTIAFLIGSISTSHLSAETTDPLPGTFKELDRFARVLYAIEKNYVAPVDDRKLIDEATRGLVRALDPHSAYLTAADKKAFFEQSNGDFVGIGVEVGIRDAALTILSTLPLGPARKAGLESGDIILAINDKTVADMPFDRIIERLRGPAGTTLKLKVRKYNSLAIEDVSITRAPVAITHLLGRLLAPDYALIHVRQFTRGTSQRMSAELKRLEAANGRPLRGAAIDLRANPGGYLDEAIRTADLFIADGTLVTTEGRDGRVIAHYKARKAFTNTDLPLVVMVDAHTASASEILAAALQDHKRAIVIGERTFGKGSVQNIFDFPDGSALKLTVAHYYSPAHHVIQSRGVSPDVAVPRVEISPKPGQPRRENDLPNALQSQPNQPKSDATIMDLAETIALAQLKAMSL